MTRPPAPRHPRRGSLILLLLIAIVFVGLIASRLAPSEAVKKSRTDEEALRSRLARLRQASDILLRLNPTWNPGNATEAIASLVAAGLFQNPAPIDPTIPANLWNTASNTWELAGNLATRTSFEPTDTDATTSFIASWSRGTPDTSAATDSQFFPSRDSSQFDDYPGQNLLGDILGTSGASLRIDR